MARQVAEIRLLAPRRVPMTPDQYRGAVVLLAELFLDAYRRRELTGGSPVASTGVTPVVDSRGGRAARRHQCALSGDSRKPTYRGVNR